MELAIYAIFVSSCSLKLEVTLGDVLKFNCGENPNNIILLVSNFNYSIDHSSVIFTFFNVFKCREVRLSLIVAIQTTLG